MRNESASGGEGRADENWSVGSDRDSDSNVMDDLGPHPLRRVSVTLRTMERLLVKERPTESVRDHRSAPQRCAGDRGSSKSQRSRRCPRTQEPQGDCNQEGPRPPREAQRITPGGHSQQPAESLEISAASTQACPQPPTP
ncbi:uncharacterized protein [Nothobranchius furzeri]|uniref:uncharacterized protein n=1 Tax=Nothobranchius furzeri TaxID=105023 RepID=UPI003904D82E